MYVIVASKSNPPKHGKLLLDATSPTFWWEMVASKSINSHQIGFGGIDLDATSQNGTMSLLEMSYYFNRNKTGFV